ncbi:MAG: nicotinate-nucleotide adenylyltransferase [Clostridia bacterium]|nr:nicotinate-nucleotide adenylyltransferase [Clostridia bacterium]
MCQKTGILGGTFNPIHTGHLFAAEAARDAFDLNQVLFIPTGDPPHKKSSRLASGEDRIQMIQKAVCDNPAFKLDTREVERKRTTYTIDTLKELKEQYPYDELYFIIGGDTLLKLRTWRDFSSVAGLCDFIVYGRFGYNIREQEEEAIRLQQSLRAKIHFVAGPYLDVSSNDIRNRLEKNQTIRYLLPDEVVIYIKEHNLYKGDW